MDNREALLERFAGDVAGLVDYALELQERLVQREQSLVQTEQSLTEAQALIAELKQQLFGAKAEKLSPEQEEQLAALSGDLKEAGQRPPPLSQDVLQELEREKLDQKQRSARRRKRRHPPPVELEKQRVVLEPADRLCPASGQARPQIGEEVSTEYDYVPGKLIVRETVRPKYGQCRGACCRGVAIAPLPPRLVPQSLLGLGLAVYLLLSRFDDHLAYYTLERIFRERHGVSLPRQQMVQWTEQIAFLLLGIYRGIWEELQQSGYLQVDESPVKVLDPEVKGKAAQGYLWFYSTPGADVFLEFIQSRSRAGPRERLKHFRGCIQTDAYEVYESLRRERPGSLKRLGCLAHVRRRFYKALSESCGEAIWFIAQIRQLYQIEDQVRESNPEQRRAARRQKAPAIWLALKRRAEELRRQPTFLPQSTLGKAVNYFLNEYTALVSYLGDGRYEIDNNLVENDVRPAAVGRKRWLFIGHPDAGWRSAVIYTIIQSCRRRGLNPQEYLSDVLQRLPAMKSHQVKDLLPSRWKPRQP